MSDPSEILVLVGRLLLWVVVTIYYILEATVLWFVPRKYKFKDIRGNVALVTGGGSGIGRLMCLRLAAEGAIVVTWDVSEAGNLETAKQVQEAGGKCHVYTVDLCDRNSVYATAAKVKEEVGKVDILINNAGVVTGKSLMDSPDDSIVKTFDVNAICHFWTTKAFLGDMMAADKGHIVTIASMAGKMGGSMVVDYCASKFAAVGFHESLQAELKVGGKFGVKTTVVCPMLISTGMFEGSYTRFFPLLEPKWVADEVVDAILMDVSTLYLPHYMWILLLKLLMLPQKSIDHLAHALDMGDLMKNFVGRRKAD
ncbi:epidermal retinol dehydrogenase 2-like isoform X6 [Eriocheir sinensis]|uniref:epidermal retinol dehydrogenase 2-like isoform X6 n=1 Tax=Eriocheir sinensis TaxID=95602 RepID=UPI0021C75FC5|nr:epidermal retinol dehydrogenase 2-like isoform X6 [Eriocheir sinensis]